MDDESMLVDFAGVENLQTPEAQVRLLREVRDDMIGCHDTKLGYYNKGLIETLIPMLEQKDLKPAVTNEIFTLLNAFLISFP